MLWVVLENADNLGMRTLNIHVLLIFKHENYLNFHIKTVATKMYNISSVVNFSYAAHDLSSQVKSI